MQSRNNDQPNLSCFNYPEFNFGTDSVFNALQEHPSSNVPVNDAFLLSDGSNFLLSDGTDLLLST
jgi:hypothetical protein